MCLQAEANAVVGGADNASMASGKGAYLVFQSEMHLGTEHDKTYFRGKSLDGDERKDLTTTQGWGREHNPHRNTRGRAHGAHARIS